MSAEKGHWPKGKSRNLDPHQQGQARALIELLRRAMERPYRHPTLGALSFRVVAAWLRVSPKAIQHWLNLTRWPPEWALAELRILLKDFRP